MKKFFLNLILKLGLQPGQKTVARQLRQPSGKLGVAVGNKMNKGNASLYDWVLEQMNIADNSRLLEIGYGNGNLFTKVFAQAQNIHITGLDFSEEMYKQAVNNCQTQIQQKQLDLHFGGSDAMPFADNSFDAVYCCNVVYFWENPQAHLAEVYRVLKPGGKFFAGIRTKQTMLLMPFTQYGFALRENHEWEEVIQQSPLKLVGMPIGHEPEMSMNAKQFTPECACIIAQKRGN